MNPYAKFLSGADLIAQLEAGPGKWEAAVKGRDLDAPMGGPGKWSLRQILAHVTDTEIAFSFRLRQAAAETDHVIQPFDQDKWAAGYAQADAETALAVFTALRNWNVQFLRGLAPETFEKTVTHPERGPMKFRTIVETMAGHEGSHLAQLENA